MFQSFWSGKTIPKMPFLSNVQMNQTKMLEINSTVSMKLWKWTDSLFIKHTLITKRKRKVTRVLFLGSTKLKSRWRTRKKRPRLTCEDPTRITPSRWKLRWFNSTSQIKSPSVNWVPSSGFLSKTLKDGLKTEYSVKKVQDVNDWIRKWNKNSMGSSNKSSKKGNKF